MKISYKPSSLRIYSFTPTENGKVKTEKDGEAAIFKSTVRKDLKFIVELKNAQSQRIANEFASNLSRIGLDESEWLRRWAKRDN